MSISDEGSFIIIGSTPPSRESSNLESISTILTSQTRRQGTQIAAPVRISNAPNGESRSEGSSWGHIESLGSSVRFDPCLKVLTPSCSHQGERDLNDLQEEVLGGSTESGSSARREAEIKQEESNAANSFTSFEVVPSSASSQEEQNSIQIEPNEEELHVERKPDYPCSCLRTTAPLSRQYSIDQEVLNFIEDGRHQKCRKPGIFHSEQILKPLTIIIGLWNPGKGLRIVFTVVFLLISLYVALGFTYTSWICLHYSTPLDVIYCPEARAHNGTLTTEPYKLITYMGQFFEVQICCIQIITYLILYISIFRMKNAADTFTFLEYAQIVSKRDWLALNIQVLIILALIIVANVDPREDTLKPNPYTIFLMYPAPNLMWISLVSGCWIFAIITNALLKFIERCQAKIRDLEDGDIDDVIDIHQHLCGHVFGTVDVLKYWFIIHWLSFAAFTVVGISLLFVKLENPASIGYSFAILTLVVYVFLCPCVYAARVTAKCRDMIGTFNRSRSRDWRATHPFHARSTLSLFIQYAERAQCGFKIGDIVFGSNLTWISFFVALCGLTIKVIGG